ncbi:MAG: biotin transporter BioY [Christensenellaceae bacterium]
MSQTINKKMTTRNMILCALFAVLIGIGARISIPTAPPITLQTLFVVLAGVLLGAKYGTISAVLYLVLCLIFPAFTVSGTIATPTFGYIIGFCVGAFVIGLLVSRLSEYKFWKLFLIALIGIAVIYAIGIIYFYFYTNFATSNSITVSALMISCVVMPFPGDVLKCLLAAWLGSRLIPVLKKV